MYFSPLTLLEYSRVVYQFGPLLRLLPLSLSHQALLVHCAWQAASTKVKIITQYTCVGEVEVVKKNSLSFVFL